MGIAQETRNEPVHVRLSSNERRMLSELTAKFGFTSTSDCVRYMLRHEWHALQTAGMAP